MKLSAKSRYGLKAMYYLGKNKEITPMPLKVVAEFTEVSSPYLEKLLGVLRHKGLVKSTRGAAGGYSLNCDPKKTSVGDVIRALEGDVLYVSCVQGKCDKTGCPNRSVFSELYTKINEVLDEITLQSMIDNN